MKNVIKIFSLILFLTVIASCGNDDEVTVDQNLEDATLPFSATEPPIDIATTTLLQSHDENANLVGSWLATANGFSGWMANFDPPADAAKSNTPIGRKTSTNGRTQEDVVVYTWSADDGTNTVTVAYQVSQTTTDFIFDIFWKFNDGDYQLFIHAQESKDALRDGFMEIYSVFPDATTPSDYILRFQWEEDTAGTLFFDMISADDGFEVNIVVSADNSGSLVVKLESVLHYQATWDASGTSGTYTLYDLDGTITVSGSWSS